MGKRRNNSHRYDDIISLPHHVSSSHPHMPVHDRAAQFSPFSALTGYYDAINETARLTNERVILDENCKEILNEKFIVIQERLNERPAVTITYFKPDKHKSGGEYVTLTGNVKKIDQYEDVVIMVDGNKIPLKDIIGLELEGAGCQRME